jgi:LacI family transcriptional regulator
MSTVAVARERMTIRQIADLAGVSIATVSRVLNGRGDVSDETRDLVTRIIREHGYTANRSARGLSAGRTGLIGVLVPLVYPAYFSGILAGAAEALSERDLQILLSPTGGEHEREVSVLDRLHGVSDGALIILPEESSEELVQLLDGGFRFVVIDPLMPLDQRIPSVSAAHASGADQAMRHLLQLGHRRIAQITGPRGWLATEDRLRGYRAGLAAAGILPDPALEVEAEPEIEPGRVAAEQLLALQERPTAIFAFNDNIAIGAIQAARARGLRVPEDLSVVGFDDVENATVVTPTLTTVRQPLGEMGRTAVSLLSRLLGGERFETLHVQLATRLVVRASTGPPPP